jgi:SAM-dependent methyltransferase
LGCGRLAGDARRPGASVAWPVVAASNGHAERGEAEDWTKYYEAQLGRAPRPLYLDAVARFDRPGRAVDLGCGDGTESLDLLARGWRVYAVDQQPAALSILTSRTPAGARDRLTAVLGSFAEVSLPPAELVYAGLAFRTARPGTSPAPGGRSWRLWCRAAGLPATCWVTATTGPAGRMPAPTRVARLRT